MLHPHHFDPNQPRVPEGHPHGGRWTRGGYQQYASLVRAAVVARRLFDQKGFQALALFAWLSRRNSADQRAIIEFRAREFHADAQGRLTPIVRLLSREEVGNVCPQLGHVQELTNEAAVEAGPSKRYEPAVYGTKVHKLLEEKIREENIGKKIRS